MATLFKSVEKTVDVVSKICLELLLFSLWFFRLFIFFILGLGLVFPVRLLVCFSGLFTLSFFKLAFFFEISH